MAVVARAAAVQAVAARVGGAAAHMAAVAAGVVAMAGRVDRAARAVVVAAGAAAAVAGAAVGVVAGGAAGLPRLIPITAMVTVMDILFTVIRGIMAIRMADILVAGVGAAGKGAVMAGRVLVMDCPGPCPDFMQGGCVTSVTQPAVARTAPRDMAGIQPCTPTVAA
ncbi:hypothetical protein JCM25156A_27180 [Komagataeibacter kakiaceti JCM 25156]